MNRRGKSKLLFKKRSALLVQVSKLAFPMIVQIARMFTEGMMPGRSGPSRHQCLGHNRG